MSVIQSVKGYEKTLVRETVKRLEPGDIVIVGGTNADGILARIMMSSAIKGAVLFKDNSELSCKIPKVLAHVETVPIVCMYKTNTAAVKKKVFADVACFNTVGIDKNDVETYLGLIPSTGVKSIIVAAGTSMSKTVKRLIRWSYNELCKISRGADTITIYEFTA